jgi:hypothetical protein
MRYFTCVGNAVTALPRAMPVAALDAPIFNICTGSGTTVRGLSETVPQLCGIRIATRPRRAAYALARRRPATRDAQRRHPNDDFVQSILEVFAKSSLRHQSVEIMVGGADDAQIDRYRLAAADALNRFLLRKAQ